jgi:hypothetical protein
MCPLGIGIRPKIGFAPVAGGVHRQEHAEGRAPRGGVAFDDPAVVADDLRNQGKSEATSLGFCGHEGVEQLLDEVRRDSGPAVANCELDRQADALARAGHLQPHAGAERRGEHDLALDGVAADRLGGVLDEVEEHLDELIPVAEHRRQRRVVVLGEADVLGEA